MMHRLSSRLFAQHALPALRRARRTLCGALALGGAWTLGACGGGGAAAALQPASSPKGKNHAAAALTQVRFEGPRQSEHPVVKEPASVRDASRLLVLGDSISAGSGASAEALCYASLLHRNVDAVYPGDVSEDLQHRFGDRLEVHNVAVVGETTAGIIARQLPRLRRAVFGDATPAAPVYGHTVVVLTAGGNNLRGELGPGGSLTGSGFATALHDLQTIFDFFDDAARFPDGVSLYFATVYDMTDGADSAHKCISGLRFAGLSDALQMWRSGYLALADGFNEAWRGASRLSRPTLRVIPVDAHHEFLGHGFHYATESNHHYNRDDPTLWLSEQDCIHPNNRGHHELRHAFYRAITGRRI